MLAANVGVTKTDGGMLWTGDNILKLEIANTRAEPLRWMIGLAMTAVLLNATPVLGSMVALSKAVGR